jgi:hypothetical protein
MVFDGKFNDFAVWAKDTVINVTTTDSTGNDDPSLLIMNAPFMPEINEADLEATATTQLHKFNGDFTPPDNWPDLVLPDFYFVGTEPHVTWVEGDLTVLDDRKVYGIFVVEGNVEIEDDAIVHGVIYLPNAGSTVTHGGSGSDEARVFGAIITRGEIDGETQGIIVQHKPEFLRGLTNNFVPYNPPMRVIAWN